ncbi:MAG: flippase [Thermohalobaculum sp.]|nr:flippase [Thermohalobaculum sp.]
MISIKRNTALNLMGTLVPTAVSLVILPVYLGAIGEARYGILAIAWLLLGYFGLFDLGLGRAAAQRIATLQDADDLARARTFWTAAALNLGFGLIGGLIVWPVAAWYFRAVMVVDDALRAEMLGAVFWLALALPMATVLSVLNGALQGRSKFLALNVVSLLGTLLFQLAPLGVALGWGADLRLILPAVLAARAVTLAILLGLCLRHVAGWRIEPPARAEAWRLLGFGGWVTVSSIVGPLMVTFDRFVIGALVNAQAVTHYTVPFQLAQRSTVLAGALSGALFPRLAMAGRAEELRLGVAAIRGLVALVTPPILAAILLAEPFLRWWLSPAIAVHSAPVAHVLLLGFWINGLALVPYTLLQAGGQPKVVAKLHLLEVVPYLGLLYLSVTYFGLVGAAAAFSLRTLVDFLFLVQQARLLGHTVSVTIIPGAMLGCAMLISSTVIFGDSAWIWSASPLMVSSLFWSWRHARRDFPRISSFSFTPRVRAEQSRSNDAGGET